MTHQVERITGVFSPNVLCVMCVKFVYLMEPKGRRWMDGEGMGVSYILSHFLLIRN